MDVDDQGHRYGNFPNYYSFNPPQNRLRVLEQSNLLSHIRTRLRRAVTSSSVSTSSPRGGDGGDSLGQERFVDEQIVKQSKKPRIENRDQQPCTDSTVDGTVYYCDLGCNEGDLTVAMASSLVRQLIETVPNDATDSVPADESDPAANAAEPIENNPTPTPAADGKSISQLKCLGLDLDPALIERARAKFPPRKSLSSDGDVDITATFKECNLCSESDHDIACTSFKNEIASSPRKDDTPLTKPRPLSDADREAENATAKQIFHLTSIFSTTMWIHVHGGDEGLRAFLERACGWTKRFLLVEPQPSGCYRKANTRLRKMGRPELNGVTSSRLKMRPEIEQEIEKVILRCGFRRVTPDVITKECNNAKAKRNGSEGNDAVTSWNRSLCLYERVS